MERYRLGGIGGTLLLIYSDFVLYYLTLFFAKRTSSRFTIVFLLQGKNAKFKIMESIPTNKTCSGTIAGAKALSEEESEIQT